MNNPGRGTEVTVPLAIPERRTAIEDDLTVGDAKESLPPPGKSVIPTFLTSHCTTMTE